MEEIRLLTLAIVLIIALAHPATLLCQDNSTKDTYDGAPLLGEAGVCRRFAQRIFLAKKWANDHRIHDRGDRQANGGPFGGGIEIKKDRR